MAVKPTTTTTPKVCSMSTRWLLAPLCACVRVVYPLSSTVVVVANLIIIIIIIIPQQQQTAWRLLGFYTDCNAPHNNYNQCSSNNNNNKNNNNNNNNNNKNNQNNDNSNKQAACQRCTYFCGFVLVTWSCADGGTCCVFVVQPSFLVFMIYQLTLALLFCCTQTCCGPLTLTWTIPVAKSANTSSTTTRTTNGMIRIAWPTTAGVPRWIVISKRPISSCWAFSKNPIITNGWNNCSSTRACVYGRTMSIRSWDRGGSIGPAIAPPPR
jgi:hypothetical protein